MAEAYNGGVPSTPAQGITVVGGSDGTNLIVLKTAADGSLSAAVSTLGGVTPVGATAAVLAGTTQAQAILVAQPGEFSITHNPGANTVATITKAAGSGTQRWVITGFSAMLTAGATAPTAAVATLNLRDGASGAGTILKSWTLGVPATAGATQGIAKSGLHIICSAATAVTIEFTAAAGANTYESVELEGYLTA